MRRAGPAPRSALRVFLASEAAGGIVLMLAAALALAVANSPLAPAYRAMLDTPLGPLGVLHWINDGLMTLFFLLVGLEIKRALVDGELADPADRRLPLVAAAAGMIVPALIYLAVVRGDPALWRGWAIPAATDIAFAIGVMALLGDRVPARLKLFLVTVAIADDMGAVAIVALAYSDGLDPMALAGAAAVLAAMAVLNRRGVVRLLPYLLLAALLWLLVLRSGVHATVAGVLAAAAIPVRPSPGAPDAAASPLHRLERALGPWVAFAVVPLFGFANAGVALDRGALAAPLTVAIMAGLFLGKQAGLLGGVLLAERIGLAVRPAGVSRAQLHGVALLAGIGFTMSLFIGSLAFPGRPDLLVQVKAGVLLGSLLSAIAGYAVLCHAARR